MKICTSILCVSFAVLAALVATTMATNSTWGHRSYYDRSLFRTQVVRQSELWRVVAVDIEYPPRFGYNPYYISEVRAIDHKRKDGGYVQLRRGGPGYRNATLHIKSDRNHGLNYTIEIYGH